jgi:hypothetical protein
VAEEDALTAVDSDGSSGIAVAAVADDEVTVDSPEVDTAVESAADGGDDDSIATEDVVGNGEDTKNSFFCPNIEFKCARNSLQNKLVSAFSSTSSL